MSFWSNPLHSVEHFFTDPGKALKNSAESILPIAGGIIGGIYGGPAGAAAGAELGGTGSNLLRGESLSQSAENAIPGAILSGVGSYVLPEASDLVKSNFPETLSSLGVSSATPIAEGAVSGAGDIGSSLDPSLFDEAGAQSFPSGALPSIDPVASVSSVSTGGISAAPASLPSLANGAPAATGAAAPPASLSSVAHALGQGNFSDALSQVGGSIGPTQALGVGGLALSALKGSSKTGAEKNQSALAGQQSALGANQIALGTSGKLTPGQQEVLQQQLQDSITQIKSQYAAMGMSGSTSEQQAIAQARQGYAANVTQLAQGEINTGLTALNQGSAANEALARQQLAADEGLSQSIAALAGSPSGSVQKQQAA